MLNVDHSPFAPVMDYPSTDECTVFDLTSGYNAEEIKKVPWGIGKYDENRSGMYTTAQFGGERTIHIGIDIWTHAESPIYAFADGFVAYVQHNDLPRDYGPTIVTKHKVGDDVIYALYGHLSLKSLQIEAGAAIKKGQQIGSIGDETVNGGWAPHLHFQLSMNDPKEGNMPGVVAPANRQAALKTYPDPRLVLGPLY